jgi:hypothetical protein
LAKPIKIARVEHPPHLTLRAVSRKIGRDL